jgi:hypothetical protein
VTEENQSIVRKAYPSAALSITHPTKSGIQVFQTTHCTNSRPFVRSTFFSHFALVGLIVLMYFLQSTSATSITNTAEMRLFNIRYTSLALKRNNYGKCYIVNE